MAMIKCPDCRNPISDTAECCPRCGCKFQSEYRRMQSIRQQIYALENDRSPRPTEPSDGIGGCAIVSIILLIAAVGVVFLGITLLYRGSGSGVLPGLLMIAAGGFAAYWFFMMSGATIMANSKHKADRKREISSYDQRPARIAELKRQLAQLESKFY